MGKPGRRPSRCSLSREIGARLLVLALAHYGGNGGGNGESRRFFALRD